MDKFDGPQAKFEKVILNFSEDEYHSKQIISKPSNGYREGDILSYEAILDLKPNILNQEKEHVYSANRSTELNYLDRSHAKSIFNKNPLINVDSEPLKLDTNRLQNGDDFLCNLIENLEQKSQKIFEPSNPSRIKENTDVISNRKTIKDYKDMIAQQGHTNHIAKKFNIKNTANQPQIFDLKLVNQLKRRMLYFLKIFTAVGRNKFLQQEQIHQIIGDKSDVFQSRSTNFLSMLFCFLYFHPFKGLGQKVQNSTLLLNPHQSLSFWLKLFLAVFNVAFFILLSIQVIYIGKSDNEKYIDLFCYVVWFFEILIHLNTQIYDSMNLISDRKQIVQAYLKNRAAFDLLPFLLLLILPERKIERTVCQCACFIKLKNILFDINEIQKKLCMLVQNYYVIQLVNLILKLLIIGHIIACMWFLVGQIELHIFEFETTWYDEGLGEDYTWWKLYLESFYWSLTLLTTGSNIATTLFQMFFTTIIMLFTTIIFGYLLNVTGQIISQFDKQDENKRLDLNIINEYMRSNKISKQLQTRVNIDLEYYYINNMDKIQEDKSTVLKKISPNLQNLLKFEYCSQVIQQIDFIKQKFSEETIHDLSSILQEEFYLPNQVIFNQNEFQQVSLIYVVQGQIELSQSIQYDLSSKIPIRLVNKGELIGQVNFFTGLSYDMSAKSTKFTKIIKINREKFLEVIQKRQKDLEVFSQLRDQVLMYENYEIVKEMCYFCKSTIHISKDCPIIHLPKSQIYYKNKFFQNIDQQRYFYTRQDLYQNTLLNHKDNNLFAKKYLKDLKKELRESEFEAPDIQYLLNNLTSDVASSDDNFEQSNLCPQLSENQKQEDQKEEFFKQFTKKSTKRFSQGISENQIAKTQNIPSQQLDTIVIESLLNNMEDTKPLPQKPAQLIQINKQYIFTHKSKQSTQQFQEEEATKKSKPLSTSFFNNLDPEQRSDSPVFENQYTKGSNNQNAHSSGVKQTEKQERSEFEKLQPDLDLNSLNKDLKRKKSVLYSLIDPWEYDKMKDYTRYFPSGNSKLILIKYSKYQRKKQKPLKKSKNQK